MNFPILLFSSLALEYAYMGLRVCPWHALTVGGIGENALLFAAATIH